MLNFEFRPAAAGFRMRGRFGKRPYYAPNPLRGGATMGGRGLGIQGLRD